MTADVDAVAMMRYGTRDSTYLRIGFDDGDVLNARVLQFERSSKTSGTTAYDDD